MQQSRNKEVRHQTGDFLKWKKKRKGWTQMVVTASASAAYTAAFLLSKGYLTRICMHLQPGFKWIKEMVPRYHCTTLFTISLS